MICGFPKNPSLGVEPRRFWRTYEMIDMGTKLLCSRQAKLPAIPTPIIVSRDHLVAFLLQN